MNNLNEESERMMKEVEEIKKEIRGEKTDRKFNWKPLRNGAFILGIMALGSK